MGGEGGQGPPGGQQAVRISTHAPPRPSNHHLWRRSYLPPRSLTLSLSVSVSLSLCLSVALCPPLPSPRAQELAQAHGALLFSIEHRYYGDSIPTASFSTPNLRWLGTEQALADAAAFVQAMNAKHGLTGPWISFGGSYSGELSAWVRIKYPHLVFAAVASSAPVTANVDYDGYVRVATPSSSLFPSFSSFFPNFLSFSFSFSSMARVLAGPLSLLASFLLPRWRPSMSLSLPPFFLFPFFDGARSGLASLGPLA